MYLDEYFHVMKRRKYIAISGSVVVGSTAGCLNIMNRGNPSGSIEDSRSPLAKDITSRPSLGDESAKYSIISVDDPSCPFCARHKRQTYPKIKSNYIDTGELRYFWRFVPFIHDWSSTAVLTLETLYVDYGTDETLNLLDLYFQNQDNINTNNVLSQTESFLQELDNIDTQSVIRKVEDEEYISRQQESVDLVRSVGIDSTPTFGVFQGDQLITEITGAQPFQTFKRLL
jgi:protein-disulfide isomerase